MPRKRKTRPATSIETQEPPIISQEPPIEEHASSNGRFWPELKPLPVEYRKTGYQRMPCPSCRRIYLDNGQQAVICVSSSNTQAAFRCRECGRRFRLPVTLIGG